MSPRGDVRGFVRILDKRTLFVPDRPGSRIGDALRNIVARPAVGLLFFFPGHGTTFRVNGDAYVTDDPSLLAASALHGSTPRLGIVVTIREAYTQCPKAFLRSELWNPARHVASEELPTGGAVVQSIIGDTFDAESYERERAERYARGEGMW